MDVFEISLDAINQSSKQLEIVSQNVANINTPGYLKAVPFNHYVDNSGQMATGERVSIEGGTIRETGRALDVAVMDGGFFSVEVEGARYITRGGHFYLDSDGYLRHPSGAFVLGESGKINVQGKDVQFKADGSVSVQGVDVEKLLVVKPKSAADVKTVGNGLYQAPQQVLEVLEARVTPKALNSANVNPSEEMVRMIELSRHMQSAQKMVNAYDQLLNVGINELGKK